MTVISQYDSKALELHRGFAEYAGTGACLMWSSDTGKKKSNIQLIESFKQPEQAASKVTPLHDRMLLQQTWHVGQVKQNYHL